MNFAHALLFYTVRGETSEADLLPLVEGGYCTKEEVRSRGAGGVDRDSAEGGGGGQHLAIVATSR